MTSLPELEAKYFATGTDTGPVFSNSSAVECLVDGYKYFNAVRDAIDATGAAGDVVYMVSWWVEDAFPTRQPPTDPGAKELKTLLAEKALAGVDVRVVIWANPNLIDHNTLASWSSKTATFLNVVSHNIASAREMRAFIPPGASSAPLEGRVLLDHSGEYTGSHHQKAAYVKAGDQVSAFVAGLDFQPDRWDKPPHNTHTVPGPSTSRGSSTTMPWGWHDAGVKVTGPATGGVLENFRSRWTEANGLPSRTFSLNGVSGPYNPTVLATPPATVPPPPATPSNQSLQVLRSLGPVRTIDFWGSSTPWLDPALAGGLHHVRETLLKAIGVASTYVYVEDQAFMSPFVLYPAIVAACERGVKVIAVMPGVADPHDGGGNPTLPRGISQLARETLVEPIVASNRSNLAIYQVDETTVHSKLILIDDEFLCIGSANFMDRSMQRTPEGADSELSIAAVAEGPLVTDVRRRLWSDHLNVDPEDATVRAQLDPLSSGLGLWRSAWSTSPPTFLHPHSKLALVGP